MNKELHELYDYTQKVIEKYKNVPADEIYDLVSDEEMIALIFNVYLNDGMMKERRAINLIKGMLVYQIHLVNGMAKGDVDEYLKYEEKRTEVQNKIFDFISLLLQNDPSLYSQLCKGFYVMRNQQKEFSDNLLAYYKRRIDQLQIAIKEKEYKTPFYNVTQGKYDGPYLTFDYSDPALKQKIETVIFPKLQQVLKEKYGDQVEAELRSNGQIWLKKWSDIDLNGEIQNMVNQISKSL